MVYPVEAALENRPDALDPVGVRHPVNKLLLTVVDGMSKVFGHAAIGCVLVGTERRL